MSFDREKVEQIIADAMIEFAKEYTVGYIKAVVHKIQDEIEGSEKPPVKLLVRAPEPDVRKQGWIVKKGAIIKNWKKRWFVVDKDYRVSYYKGEKEHELKDPKTGKQKVKPKGQFSCYGYKVKKDDDKEAKEHQLKLKPYWDDEYTKRIYYCQLATKEECDAWKKMFQDCAANASSPMHADPVRRAAFEYAYTKMENYWYFWPTGSESDMLAYVVFRRVERMVLNDVYNGLPNGGFRWKIIDKIRGTVGGLIGAPVEGAWKSACVAIDKLEKPTEENIRKLVTPLFDAIKKMKNAVQAKFDEKVVPVISALMAPVAEKLMPKIAIPLIKAQKELIEEFCKHHKDDTRGSWHLYWELRKRENEYDTVLEVARSLLDAWELSELPSKIMDSCFELLELAHYNYTNVDGKNLATTCNKLLHDCLTDQRTILTWMVNVLVLKPFNEKFGVIVDELCGPLEELIPDAVKEFLSPSDTIKAMASAAMASALQACINAGDQSAVPAKMVSYFKEHNVDVSYGGEQKSAAILETKVEAPPPAYEVGFLNLSFIQVNTTQHFDTKLISRFYNGLMKTNFPIEDELEPLDVWLQQLDPKFQAAQEARRYTMNQILALDHSQTVTGTSDPVIAGGISFEYYKEGNAALVTYFVVDPSWRRKGLLGELFRQAVTILNAQAKALGKPALSAIFLETNKAGVEDGVMVSTVRHEIQSRLGFCRLCIDYVQPPLSEGQAACSDLLLTVYKGSLPKDQQELKEGTIPAKTVRDWYEGFCHSLMGYDTDPATYANAPWYKATMRSLEMQEATGVRWQAKTPWKEISPFDGLEFLQVNTPQQFNKDLISRFYNGLMKTNFPIEDELEPLDVWHKQLDPAFQTSQEARRYIMNQIVTIDKTKKQGEDHVIAGGISFEYYKEGNTALVTYFVVDPNYRRVGLVRELLRQATLILDAQAKLAGHPGLAAMLLETNKAGVEDGVLLSTLRHDIQSKLGFCRLVVNYIQPPLDEGMKPCSDLLLTIHKSTVPKEQQDQKEGTVPARIIREWYEGFCHALMGYETDPKSYCEADWYKATMESLQSCEASGVRWQAHTPWKEDGSS
jgi:ribosomal protein S18 acetylase RimI-like enzyme